MTELNLTHLGKQSPIENNPKKVKLDLIPNEDQFTDYVVRFSIPEFQSLCPVTGQPDYATVIIDYVPGAWLLESKSLKLWMFAFRNHGSYHEAVTMAIGSRFRLEVIPQWMRVASFFNARGGISIDTTYEHGKLPENCNPLSLDIRPYHSRI